VFFGGAVLRVEAAFFTISFSLLQLWSSLYLSVFDNMMLALDVILAAL
jgi:hypothetical protein